MMTRIELMLAAERSCCPPPLTTYKTNARIEAARLPGTPSVHTKQSCSVVGLRASPTLDVD